MLDWQGEKWGKKTNFKAKIYGKWATPIYYYGVFGKNIKIKVLYWLVKKN